MAQIKPMSLREHAVLVRRSSTERILCAGCTITAKVYLLFFFSVVCDYTAVGFFFDSAQLQGGVFQTSVKVLEIIL